MGVRARRATYRFLDSEELVYKTKAAEKSKSTCRNVSFPRLRYIYLEGSGFGTTMPGVDMQLDYLM